MSVDEQVQSLEEEYKLLRCEVQQTLGNVRDFLLGLKVPLPPEKIDPPELHKEHHEPESPPGPDSGYQEIPPLPEMGELPPDPSSSPEPFPSAPRDAAPQNPPLPATGGPPPGPSSSPEPFPSAPYDAATERDVQQPPVPEPYRSFGGSPDWGGGDDDRRSEPPHAPAAPSHPEQGQSKKKTRENPYLQSPAHEPEEGSLPPVPGVNLLANLMRWSHCAQNEIGLDSLEDLLDIYAASGNLCVEMKGFILQLCQTQEGNTAGNEAPKHLPSVMEQLSAFFALHQTSGGITSELADSILHFIELMILQNSGRPAENPADVWARLMLELHGILIQEKVPLQLLKPVLGCCEEDAGQGEAADPEESNQKPARLKLVLSGSNGTEEEFSLDLSPKKNKTHIGESSHG